MHLGDGVARVARVICLVGVTAAFLVLAGCTAGPIPGPTSSSSSTAAAPDGEASASPTPTAVARSASVTIASVLVDGTAATVGGVVIGAEVDGAVCEYTLTPASGAPVTATFESLANAGTTSCGSIDIPIDQLARGSWTVELSVVIDGDTIISAPVALEIP